MCPLGMPFLLANPESPLPTIATERMLRRRSAHRDEKPGLPERSGFIAGARRERRVGRTSEITVGADPTMEEATPARWMPRARRLAIAAERGFDQPSDARRCRVSCPTLFLS